MPKAVLQPSSLVVGIASDHTEFLRWLNPWTELKYAPPGLRGAQDGLHSVGSYSIETARAVETEIRRRSSQTHSTARKMQGLIVSATNAAASLEDLSSFAPREADLLRPILVLGDIVQQMGLQISEHIAEKASNLVQSTDIKLCPTRLAHNDGVMEEHLHASEHNASTAFQP